MQTFASNRYPPIWDINFGDSFKALNFSQIDFDWEFFQSYTTTKMKDMILEVRHRTHYTLEPYSTVKY